MDQLPQIKCFQDQKPKYPSLKEVLKKQTSLDSLKTRETTKSLHKYKPNVQAI